jgi:hypothetical protein
MLERDNFMKLRRLFVAILLLCISLSGQSRVMTGAIHGLVRDAKDVPLSGAKITIRHLRIGISRTYRSSTEGRFTAELLPVGTYELSVQLTNFETVRITGMTVTMGKACAIIVSMRRRA